MSRYRTSPADLTGMPPGVPHIIANEAAERFSFYGMKAVLAVFMAKYLHFMGESAGEAMSETRATANVHLFAFAVYVTPLLGALIADLFWGKYRTIITLSLVYVAGHAALACMGLAGEAAWWLVAGLALISLGSGGIKPCVSAHVGDQFGERNAHLLPKIFNWFYFSINLGAMVSMLLTPWLLEWHGPHWAFGVPGVLMALATFVFWLGRGRFTHVPADRGRLSREWRKPEVRRSLWRLAPLYLFVAMFWALFDQTGSTWVFQAQDMDRQFLGMDWLPSQVQSLNSVFVLSFIPLFAYFLYPAISRLWPLTPLRKIGLGLFLMTLSFALVAVVQAMIDAGGRPNIGWQVLAYALLTASEVMVSIVAMEFAYTQAPRTMKSLVMCFYLLAVAFGNLFTTGINLLIEIAEPEFSENGVSAGYDVQFGTADDLAKTPDGLQFAEKPLIDQAIASVAARVRDEGVFPKEFHFGEESPLHYQVLNSRTVRLSHPGPDGNAKTPWDVGAVLTLPEAATEERPGWSESLRPDTPWLERRKAELAAKDVAPKEPARYAEFFSTEYYAGGGSRLEGARYFHFFAALMLATALLFIPYALKYRGKTYLQG
ncbi:MAG: POT family MFS transporter [Verrucomicrobiales bacterium]